VVKQAEVDGNTVKVFQRLEEQGGAVNTCAFYSNSLIASGSGSVSILLKRLFWVVPRLMWLGAGFTPTDPQASYPHLQSECKIPVDQLSVDSKL
jgi:hypothetical protein